MISVTKIQIPALPTKKPRRLYVYLPKNYRQSGKRYPVLYMFDGHNVFYDSHAAFGKSWGMKQYLEKSGLELILVAVACNPEGNRRLFEYAPWSFHAPKPFNLDIEGLGKITMDWFTKELKPEIDRTYRTLPDREHTFIAGSSMGGLMSLYALVEYNDVFSGAAALSPSLWAARKDLKPLIKSHPLARPTRLYMDLGSGETMGNPAPVMFMFDLAKEFSRAGAEFDARNVPGGQHCEADWEKRIPIFLPYLL